MRKTVVGLATLMICSGSYAQSRMTLYGIIDEGLMYQSNVSGGKKTFLESQAGRSPSRWGVSGLEELGGGLNAIFTLESGINLNNGQLGQGGTEFGRQAYLGLSSDRLGSLTFGRQYDMVFYFPEFLTGATLVGSAPAQHPGDFDNAGNTVRVNNAIRYMSPEYRGFTFGALYSMGGVAGDFTAKSGYSVGVGYTNGPLKIGAAFDYFKNPTSTAGTGFFTSNANGVSPLSYSLNKAYASAQAYQTAVVGANYTIGAVTLAASYSNVQYASLGQDFSNGTAIFNNIDVAAMYRFNAFLTVAVGYDFLTSKGVRTADQGSVGNQHYHQIFFSTDYVLSKRTDLYFSVGWQHASGTSSIGSAAVANIDNLGDSSNNHQLLTRATIRHRF